MNTLTPPAGIEFLEVGESTNGDRFLKEALQAAAAQTYRDCEFVISDNASTDRTADICAEFVAKDPRFRY